MSRLSTCIFEWDTEDMANLCQVKAAEENFDASAARRLLTPRELALHCRRRTRRAETTTNLIQQLILKRDNGLDTLGIPIFDQHSWTRSGQRRRNTFSASKIQTAFSCVPPDWNAEERWRGTQDIPLCTRFSFAGVVPPSHHTIHSRFNDCTVLLIIFLQGDSKNTILSTLVF